MQKKANPTLQGCVHLSEKAMQVQRNNEKMKLIQGQKSRKGFFDHLFLFFFALALCYML